MRHDAEQALGAREKAHQIEAGFIFVGAATAVHHCAVRQNDRQAEHIAAGHTVFQAARTPGICGDISADAAILQTGRVGGIEEVFFAGGLLELSCDDARLDHGDKIPRVDLQNPVHAIHAKHDAPLHRGAAADIPIAGAARRHWHSGTTSLFEDERCLLGIGWKNHGRRYSLGEPFVGGIDGRGALDYAIGAEFFTDFPNKCRIHGWCFAWKKCQDSATPSAAGFEAKWPPAASTVARTSGIAFEGQQGCKA